MLRALKTGSNPPLLFSINEINLWCTLNNIDLNVEISGGQKSEENDTGETEESRLKGIGVYATKDSAQGATEPLIKLPSDMVLNASRVSEECLVDKDLSNLMQDCGDLAQVSCLHSHESNQPIHHYSYCNHGLLKGHPSPRISPQYPTPTSATTNLNRHRE